MCIAFISNLLIHLDKKSSLFTLYNPNLNNLLPQQDQELLLRRCSSLALHRYNSENMSKLPLLNKNMVTTNTNNSTNNSKSAGITKQSICLFGSSHQLVSILINKVFVYINICT